MMLNQMLRPWRILTSSQPRRDDKPVTLIHGSKISDIQVLRGISILFVLFHHFSLSATLFSHFPTHVQMPFFLGVELFFIISGYVVTMSLHKDQFNGLRFFIKRVFRLMPAILLFLAFSYLMLLFMRQADVPAVNMALFDVDDAVFFKQALSILGGYFTIQRSTGFYMTGAMWSLSVEDQFYGAIIVVSLLAVALGRLTRISAKWWVLGASALLLAVLLRLRFQIFLGRSATSVRPILSYLVTNDFDFLPLGVMLAMFDLAFPGWTRKKLSEIGPSLTGYLLLVPMALVAVCEIYFIGIRGRVLTGLGFPVAAFGFGILVLLAGNQCAFAPTRGPVYRLLEYFGNRSYTYYLFHFPMMVGSWYVIFRFFPSGFNSDWRYGIYQVVITMVLLAPLVEVIYQYVEMPLTRFGKRLADGPREPLQIPSIHDDQKEMKSRAA